MVLQLGILVVETVAGRIQMNLVGSHKMHIQKICIVVSLIHSENSVIIKRAHVFFVLESL